MWPCASRNGKVITRGMAGLDAGKHGRWRRIDTLDRQECLRRVVYLCTYSLVDSKLEMICPTGYETHLVLQDTSTITHY